MLIALLALLVATPMTLAGCSTAHLVSSGDKAWNRGLAAKALANWRAARSEEGHLLSAQGRAKLENNIAEAVSTLTRPAMQASIDAIDAGNGHRALDILLPLYGRKGLYQHLSRNHLRGARERMQPILGEALATAAGVKLEALAQGQGAVDSASSRVKAVRQKIERYVNSRDAGPLVHILENIARPAIARGWQLVDDHLKAGRTDDAVGLGQTLAGIFPNDRQLQSRFAQTRQRAANHHRAKARQYAGKPGLQWAHYALVARYGGGSQGADAIRTRLRMANFRVSDYGGCGSMRAAVRGAIQRGNGGVPVTVSVRATGCREINKRWATRQQVSYLEWRTRQVRVQETYTAYESQRKCKYVQVYANTTCMTSRTGKYTVRRTCTPNYSTMQRCSNVSVPVQRQRWVTKTQRYQVKLSLLRTNNWIETGLAYQGQAVVSWPGGTRTIPFSYSKGYRDHGFNDKAGRRTAKIVAVQAYRTEAGNQIASRVHALHNEVLRPLAAKLQQQALASLQAGDTVGATDLGLQAWLVGGQLVGTNTQTLAQLLTLPPAVASNPANWQQPKGRIAYRMARNNRRRRRRWKPRNKPPVAMRLPQSLAQAMAGGLQTPPEELYNPQLPPPDHRAMRLYEELRPTAFQRRNNDEVSAEMLVVGGPSVLDGGRLALSLLADLHYRRDGRIYAGVELSALGLGTSGFVIGAEGRTGRRSDWWFGARYRSHELVSAPGLSGGQESSNLDAYLRWQKGQKYGVFAEAALNVAAWIGDDNIAHYHPLTAGVHGRWGLLSARAGAVYHVGAGVLRWFGGVGVVF